MARARPTAADTTETIPSASIRSRRVASSTNTPSAPAATPRGRCRLRRTICAFPGVGHACQRTGAAIDDEHGAVTLHRQAGRIVEAGCQQFIWRGPDERCAARVAAHRHCGCDTRNDDDERLDARKRVGSGVPRRRRCGATALPAAAARPGAVRD